MPIRVGSRLPVRSAQLGALGKTTIRPRDGRNLVLISPSPSGPSGRQRQPKISPRPASQAEPASTRSVPDQYQSLPEKALRLLSEGSRSVSGISTALGQKRVSGQLKIVLGALLGKKRIELTILDRRRNRWQRYRLTAKGRASLAPRSQAQKS